MRTENELIPSFYRNVKDSLFVWISFQDRSPIGANWDVLGNGKMKLLGNWG